MVTLPQLIAKNSQVIPAEDEVVIPESVIPATDEKVYDKFWITQLSFLAPSPTEEAKIIAVLAPARDVVIEEQTVKELMPDGNRITLVIDDIFQKAAEDEVVEDVLIKSLTAIMNEGISRNILEEGE